MGKQKKLIECPCCSGLKLSDCCEPYISLRRPAPTAEALMRSRFSAYTQHDEAYILSTWHPSTRPVSLPHDTDKKNQWTRLKIIQTDSTTVEFIAYYKIQGKTYQLHEHSRFVLEGERWYYLDGQIDTLNN